MEQPCEHGSQRLELRWRQFARTSFEARERDGLYLLQVEDAGTEKRLGTMVFPAVPANGRRVRNKDNQRQFVISGIITQDDTGPHFRGHPQVHHQTSRGAGLLILGLQRVQHQEPLVGVAVAVAQHVGVLLHFKDEAGQITPFRAGEPGDLGGDFCFAHAARLRLSAAHIKHWAETR